MPSLTGLIRRFLFCSAALTLCVRAAPKLISLAPSSTRFSLTAGVDRGPSCSTPGASITSELHEIGSSLIRTHDDGSLDWCVLFPNASADTQDPSSYDFAAGDRYFELITSSGFVPYFRIGSSWGIPNEGCIRPDPAVFAAVAVNTVRHYNDAAFGGGFSGKKVRAWEIGNEPDGGRFWNLTAADFYLLFDTTARALIAYDADLVVGGPGVSNTLAPSSRPFAFGLLDYVAEHGTPISFYSWHMYGTLERHPENCYRAAIPQVRAYIASKGLHLQQHVTEWAGAILGNESTTSSPMAAAYVGAALTYFAQAPDVAVAVYYPGCEGAGTDGSWGLFDDFGNATGGSSGIGWRPQGRAYEAAGVTLRDTPFSLTPDFAGELDYAVLAGADAPTDAARVSVVVSAQQSTYDSFVLRVPLSGASGGTAALSVYLIDAAHAAGEWIVANATVPVAADGIVTVTQAFAPPAVAWVVARAIEA